MLGLLHAQHFADFGVDEAQKKLFSDRDGFMERGAQTILVLGAPSRCHLFDCLSEMREVCPSYV